MAFKGKDGGTWKDASAVYGKSGGSWLYGKSAWAKKDGSWQRAWTDCRKYDESGGRDWSSPSTTSSYSGSCLSRTRTDTTTRTKEGCPNDVRSVTVSDPTCGNAGGACYSDVTQAYLNAYGVYSEFSFAGVTMFLYYNCANQLWATHALGSQSSDKCYVNGEYIGSEQSRLLSCSTNEYIYWNGVCGDAGIFC